MGGKNLLPHDGFGSIVLIKHLSIVNYESRDGLTSKVHILGL